MFWFILLAFVPIRTNAQQNSGITPFEAQDKHDIDQIGFASGELLAHIPLVAYPQRGGALKLSFSVQYITPAYYLECYPGGDGCESGHWNVPSNPGVAVMAIVDDQNPTIYTYVPTSKCGSESWQYTLEEPNGWTQYLGTVIAQSQIYSPACHQPNATTFPFSAYGTGYTYTNSTGVLIDRHGIRYSTSGRDDANGNKISATYSETSGVSTYTDTTGRAIQSPSTLSATTNYSGCTGPVPTASAGLWTVPAPEGGEATYKFCYASVSVLTNFKWPGVAEYSTIITLLQSVVLPNGTAWTFEYNSRNSGDPLTVNYGQLTEIIYPTGGSITYTYANVTDTQCPAGLPTCVTPAIRRIATRAEDANDGSGPHVWQYQWAYSASQTGVLNVTVRDPLGNNSVYTMNGPSGPTYETLRQTYQGSVSPSNLLQSVSTTYQTASTNGIEFWFPTGQTTTWADGEVSGITTNYNTSYGQLLSKGEYDFGKGVMGTLLRQTVSTYMALSGPNSAAYLANNLIDLPYTVQVQNGSGGQVALTTFKYDETALASSGLTANQQFDTAPPTGTYRGNLTSTYKWLNSGSLTCPGGGSGGSGSNVISRMTYFDAGILNTSADSCGHTTTYAYSLNYWAAYPTTITNAVGQPTTMTYDANTGLLASTTDPNLLQATLTYEIMWRPSIVVHPDGGQDSMSYQDTVFPANSTKTSKINSAQSESETNVVDGLGRKTQHQITSDPQGTVYSETTYDPAGRIATTSNPHRTCGVDPTSSCGITTYGYDVTCPPKSAHE